MRVYDPSDGSIRMGESIADAVGHESKGRPAIVAVSQRSAFIRSIHVPNVAAREIGPILSLNLAQHLPIDLSDCVLGFRLGAKADARGRIAIVGAMRSQSLRKIKAEVEEAKLDLEAACPIAFASWLAAKKASLTNCAVVSTGDDLLSIDIISDGELFYSRTAVLPDDAEGVEAEIARTFKIAEVPPAPVLAFASSAVASQFLEPKDPLELVRDLKTVEKELFTFELDEESRSRETRRNIWVAGRAILAACVAALLGLYVYLDRVRQTSDASRTVRSAEAFLERAKTKKAEVDAAGAEAEEASKTLDIAFHPSQNYSDILLILGAKAPKDAWFTGATLQRGKPMLLRGDVPDGKDVPKYALILSENPRFKEVKVVSAAKTNLGKAPIVQFVLSGYAMGLLPLPKPQQESKI